MKELRHIALIVGVALSLALFVPAQKGGDKKRVKRPPKNRVVIKPGEKTKPPPRRNHPRDRSGKSGMAFYIVPTGSNGGA